MRIRWKKDCVVETNIRSLFMKKGQENFVNIIAYAQTLKAREDKRFPILKFRNGLKTMAVSREWFDIIKSSERKQKKKQKVVGGYR